MATPRQHDPASPVEAHRSDPPPAAAPPPVRYGQAVVGPPGSGKTTYCDGMQQYLRALGRNCLVVNFDPANERPRPPPAPADEDADDDRDGEGDEERSDSNHLPYDTLLDVTTDVICLSSVMERFGLGPNGGLLYCMEYIDRHLPTVISLLRGRLEDHDGDSPGSTYVVFDLPGQSELYTHNDCVRNTLRRLVSSLNLRLTAVQLIDSVHCLDAHKFLSAALLGTATMVRLELPSVNVLSKIDLLKSFGGGGRDNLAFNLDFFTGVTDPGRLVDYLDEDAPPGFGGGGGGGGGNDDGEDDYADDEEYRAARRRTRSGKSRRRHRRLHEQLADVLEDFNLLEFVPLDVRDAASMGRVVARVDRSNGYVFGVDGRGGVDGGGDGVEDLFRCAVRADEFLNGGGPEDWSAFDGGMAGVDVRERTTSGGTMGGGGNAGGGGGCGGDDRVLENSTP